MEFSDLLILFLYSLIGVLIVNLPGIILISIYSLVTGKEKNFLVILMSVIKSLFPDKKLALINSLFLVDLLIFIFLILIFLILNGDRAYRRLGSLPPSAIDQIVRGKIAYDIPDTMDVDNHYKGVVAVTKAMNDSILFIDLDSSYFSLEEIIVSSPVKIRLIDPTGENFVIKPLNTEEQIIDTASNTIWRWNIQPITPGENELMLIATVRISEFESNYKDVSVFSKTIIVNASFAKVLTKFISHNWQSLMTVIVIPIVLLLLNFLRETKGRRKNSHNSIGFKISKSRNDQRPKL